MKQLFILLILIIVIITTPPVVFAQGMPAPSAVEGIGTQSAVSSDGHTAREEAEGKAIWEKIQTKQVECKNLTDDNYGSLGEYFMGQMVGSSHEAMNNMMMQMMGEEVEKQMHVVMGKRLNACDTSAQLPQNGVGFMPMMWMMGSTGSPQVGGGGNPMMGTDWGNMTDGLGGFGVLGWLSMLMFWILLILGVIALIRYLGGSGKRSDENKSPLDILKERYARGEIDKKEFEEMKKDLR